MKIETASISALSGATGKREREREAALALLRRMLGDSEAAIGHKSSGAPFIPERSDICLSVSHSGDLVAVALSTAPLGIDIQIPSARLERVRSRFISPLDAMPDVAVEGRDPLLIMWTIKEAVYKAALTEGLPLKSIIVKSIEKKIGGESDERSCKSGENSSCHWLSTVEAAGRAFSCITRFRDSACLTVATALTAS